MADQQQDFTSPYDDLFHAFFATGFRRINGKLDEKSVRNKTLSYARSASSKMSKRFNGDYDDTSIFAALRMQWDKDVPHKYSLTEDSISKMVELLRQYGYEVIEPE